MIFLLILFLSVLLISIFFDIVFECRKKHFNIALKIVSSDELYLFDI